MVLEATMVVIDNSEFTRNGDYPTSRFEAQLEAVDLIFQSKVNSNPENTVGLLASGGVGPQVLSTLTSDYGKILSGIHDTKIHGDLHLATGIQVAALALKHRQNKVQHQRIIVFVGSPINENEKELEKLAKKMKKNNIAFDFINYGEESINTTKLENFTTIVNNSENSHLVTVPPSNSRLLYEVIASSPIIIGEDGSGGAGDGFGNGSGDGFDFGSDPNMDPDLALALRLSLEEEQARQAREHQSREAQVLESVPEDQQESQQPQQPQQSQPNDDESTQVEQQTQDTNEDNDGDTQVEDAK